jgi:hypothetical protein
LLCCFFHFSCQAKSIICSGCQEHTGAIHAVTPMGYFMGAIWTSLLWCVRWGLILHGKNKVFQSNRSLDGIWRHIGALFCNWEWIKWFRRLLTTRHQFILWAFMGTGMIAPISWHPLHYAWFAILPVPFHPDRWQMFSCNGSVNRRAGLPPRLLGFCGIVTCPKVLAEWPHDVTLIIN